MRSAALCVPLELPTCRLCLKQMVVLLITEFEGALSVGIAPHVRKMASVSTDASVTTDARRMAPPLTDWTRGWDCFFPLHFVVEI